MLISGGLYQQIPKHKPVILKIENIGSYLIIGTCMAE
jgi:hypothetical protein